MLNTKIEKRNISKINCFSLFAKEIVFKDEIICAPTDDAVKIIPITDLEKLSPAE